ncbi:MAG: hypothetical protein IJ709_04970 [Selenomonas sp.]|nr:hypothetical protein [Selenomonas sp.]
MKKYDRGILLLLNKQKILFLSFSGVLCLGSSLAGAAQTDNLQETCRQAQERQERLEQDSGVRLTIQQVRMARQK